MGLLKPSGSRGRAAATALAQEAGELKEGPRARRVRPIPWRCAHLPAGTPPARNLPIAQPSGPEHPSPHASPDSAIASVAVDKPVAHIPAAGAPVLLYPPCGTGPSFSWGAFRGTPVAQRARLPTTPALVRPLPILRSLAPTPMGPPRPHARHLHHPSAPQMELGALFVHCASRSEHFVR